MTLVVSWIRSKFHSNKTTQHLLFELLILKQLPGVCYVYLSAVSCSNQLTANVLDLLPRSTRRAWLAVEEEHTIITTVAVKNENGRRLSTKTGGRRQPASDHGVISPEQQSRVRGPTSFVISKVPLLFPVPFRIPSNLFIIVSPSISHVLSIRMKDRNRANDPLGLVVFLHSLLRTSVMQGDQGGSRGISTGCCT